MPEKDDTRPRRARLTRDHGMSASRLDLAPKDKAILAELGLDARQNLTGLAHKVHLSKQVVSYRIKQLEAMNVIRGYHAIPDVYRLGKAHFRVFVKYHQLDGETESGLVRELSRCPEISWLTLLDGDFDLEFVVWSDNIMEFEEVYDEILARFGRYFQEKYFSIGTRVEYLPLRFLNPGAPAGRGLVFGGAYDRRVLNDQDKRILYETNRNGRISLANLAKKLGISVPAAKNRLQGLVESGVIIGFGLKIDHKRLGLTYRKVLLKLNTPAKERIDRIAAYLRRQESVIFLVKTIGAYDFEFELLTESNEEFYHFMKAFRSHFAADIKFHSSVIVHDELKYGQLSLRSL
ncbi:MAG: Lrp/AsnC family transcriptional regulator [Acidobacteriota bacterium]|jgi:Lrp/AsnC family leucine-responsive transcriptional regulator